MESDPIVVFAGAISEAVADIPKMFAFFTTQPVVYFTALAFVIGCVSVARKLVPMKKR